MATRGQGLRIFDGWDLGRTAPTPESEGHPKVIGRANGWPLEARVWRSRPPGVSDAIWHPTGIWLAVRVLGAV